MRSLTHIDKINNEMTEKRVALGVADDLAEIEGLSPAALVTLGEAEIKTLDDLGDLAGDELIEILGDFALSIDEANSIIMSARAHWFDDETEDNSAETSEDADTVSESSEEDTATIEEVGSP